jgi:hypothetical protein
MFIKILNLFLTYFPLIRKLFFSVVYKIIIKTYVLILSPIGGKLHSLLLKFKWYKRLDLKISKNSNSIISFLISLSNYKPLIWLFNLMKKFFKIIALINVMLGIDIIFNHLNFDLSMKNFFDEISDFYNTVSDKIKTIYSEHGLFGLVILSIQALIKEFISIIRTMFNYFIKLLNYIKNKLINLLKDTKFEEVKPLEYPKIMQILFIN